MADNVDNAQELMEDTMSKALNTIRSKIPPFRGYCASCGTKIEKGTYCGKICRDDS